MSLQPFVAIRNWWTQTFNRFASLPFLFILIGIEVYFYINGKAHFSNWDSSYGHLIQAYLIMTIIFLLWAGRNTQEQLRKPLKDSVLAFVMFFIGTYIILLLVSATGFLKVGSPLSHELFWPTVIVQVCVVATAEELMFRGVILELMGVIISAIVFAAWHMYAYQIIWYQANFASMNWGAVIFAFVMGLILALVAKRKEWGLPATIGIHASYNLFVAGAFVSASLM